MTDLAHDHPAWPPAQRRLMGMIFATPLYRSTLLRRRPTRLSAAPPDPWPGNDNRGAAIIDGSYAFADTTVRPTGSPWDEVGGKQEWYDALHAFAWLRDLRACGGDNARRHARKLTAEWLTRNYHWSAAAWRADVMGRRLTALISHFELFFASAPDPFRSLLLASMARQARHLGRIAGRDVDGLARISAIKGLLFSGLCIPDETPLLARATKLLETELHRQIAPDGCHLERSPEGQLQLLCDLVDMRAALSASRHDSLPALTTAIERVAPMLRLFRHGDGGLTLFNGSDEADRVLIDLAIAQSGNRGKAPVSSPQGGFERLVAGRLLAITDCGTPSPIAPDNHTHAGTLGLEVSFGKERLIVNCGPAITPAAQWHDAARATAAHSTLAIEDTNSSEITPNPTRRVTRVHADRQETDGNIWLSTSHNGYAGPFGLIHHRRLYMAAAGNELRGEDALTSTDHDGHGSMTGNPENRAFVIRFHVHPLVSTSLVQNGTAVLLRLPGGSGWRLRAGGAKIDLAESIYFGDGDAKRTQQIVLSGRTSGNGATVKWALRQEGGKGNQAKN